MGLGGEAAPDTQQRLGTDGRQRRRREAHERLALRRVHAFTALLQLAQRLSGGAKDAVRGQTFRQVGGDLLHLRIGFFGEQQGARLQEQQLAADHQKVGEQLGVQGRLRVDVRQVLIGDLRQTDLRDGQPALLDQQQQ